MSENWEKAKLFVSKGKKENLITNLNINGTLLPFNLKAFNITEKDNNLDVEVIRVNGQVEKIKINGEIRSKSSNTGFNKSPQSINNQNKNQNFNNNKNIQQNTNTNIFDLNYSKLPQDTKKILKLFDIDEIDNFNLRLNKVVKFVPDKEKYKAVFFNKDKNKNTPLDKVDKVESNFFNNIVENQINLIKNFFNNSGKYKEFKMKTNRKMIIGLGGASVYETSMTLHHIYGIPYIPSSSIKGTLRTYVINNFFEGEELKAIENIDFCYLFGSSEEITEEINKQKIKKQNVLKTDQQGSIIFFDSFPIEKPNIEVDIMNPHFSEYYSDNSGKKPPTDNMKPIPIHFLTVKDTEFKFFIGAKNNKTHILETSTFKKYNVHNLLDLTEKLLQECLKDQGIGAKTAVGYGYFE